ncbi:MgtC/SapB family protein [Ralstonia wenshanensis]|jgi:putative Mg2+ transporter-C (MgtC) family protein|uniref:MgtC/SapB family protein n=1 Tax=Ralstonia TaxID=48736 RepID=UPI001E627336|nr:MgtC/SapB family protein [Ralstonia wenshanensis]MDY7507461.1 MgtC/SapB family protein [Ralstonia wenshanensis]UGS92366.1 MgtC/SapB family protein [Ralstonia wenshanensis]CAJ0819652.1 Protein MgtC [Ralstonia wenshanensis]
MTLQAIVHLNVATLVDSFISLASAFALGSLIGFERQVRQRTAGLRTNALVAVAASAFVDMAAQIGTASDTTRVIAYVVSGVGFLGAGTIMKEGLNVRGLNTAATLWGSAAVGAAAGSDLVGQAILITLFVLASNILLRPVVDRINRTPLDNQASEVTYTMCVISTSERQKEALADLERLLEEASYPISDLSVEPFGDDHVEIEAMLMSTAVNAAELDRIVTSLQSQPHVAQAFWNPSTTE